MSELNCISAVFFDYYYYDKWPVPNYEPLNATFAGAHSGPRWRQEWPHGLHFLVVALQPIDLQVDPRPCIDPHQWRGATLLLASRPLCPVAAVILFMSLVFITITVRPKVTLLTRTATWSSSHQCIMPLQRPLPKFSWCQTFIKANMTWVTTIFCIGYVNQFFINLCMALACQEGLQFFFF